MLAPVTLTRGSCGNSGYSYHVRLSPKQEAGLLVYHENNEDIDEMIERIFLNEKETKSGFRYRFHQQIRNSAECTTEGPREQGTLSKRRDLRGLRSFGLWCIKKLLGNVCGTGVLTRYVNCWGDKNIPIGSGLEHNPGRPFVGVEGTEGQTFGAIGNSLHPKVVENAKNISSLTAVVDVLNLFLSLWSVILF